VELLVQRLGADELAQFDSGEHVRGPASGPAPIRCWEFSTLLSADEDCRNVTGHLERLPGMRRRLPAVILAAVSCLALSATGCAATRGTSVGTLGTGTPGTGTTHARLATTAVSPAQQAKTAAAAILRAFVPPPGATRQVAEPARARHSLDPVGGSEWAHEVRATSWWLASSQFGSPVDWETAHLPVSTFRWVGSTSGDIPGPFRVTAQFYAVRPVPRGLVGQYLIVSVADLGGGTTAIRVDAEVGYRPARPAGEMVPATARAVTISEIYGSPSPGATTSASATITRVSIVWTLAALVNGLPLYTGPVPAPCPLSLNSVLELTFRASATGRPLAVAEGPADCGGTLALTVAGKQWPLLDASGPFSTRVLQIAGLRWTMTQGGAPLAP
jgi:hypothetical protein